MKRAGFTLVELLVAVVVAAMLGTALTRLLVNDARFVGRQEAMLGSRRTARSAMNWAASELRLVTDGGLVAASSNSITVRVPYAFGMMCDRVGNAVIAALLPLDSLAYVSAVAEGMAWQSTSGVYQFDTSVGVAASADSTACTSVGVRPVPGGRLVGITGLPAGGPNAPPPAAIGYLFQTVTYSFASSVDLPGRIALWRTVGGTGEELVAPFDATAGFRFLTGSSLSAQVAPPGSLDAVRGLELRFVGASEETPRGATGPATFDLVTQVRFFNRP